MTRSVVVLLAVVLLVLSVLYVACAVWRIVDSTQPATEEGG